MKKGSVETESDRKTAKNAWFLGSSSLLNDAGGDMIAPILPFYVISMGGGGIAIGLLSGLREGLSSVFKMFGGWFSDKLGKRKFFVFLGYLLSFIFKFFIGIANSWNQILLFVSLERFGKFRDAPRDAIIARHLKNRGKNFGIIQMLDTIGGVIGTLIVLFLFWKFNFGFKTIIFIAAGISFLSLFPLLFVKDVKTKPIKKSLFEGLRSLDKRLKYFVFVATIFSFANFGLYMFLLLIARDITGSIIYSLIFYVLFNLVFAFFVIPFGKLSDSIGRKKILFLGYSLFLLVVLGFIFFRSFAYLFVLFPLYGMVYAITHSSQKALVSDLANSGKGTAMGFLHMSTGLASIPGGLIAGILWDINSSWMFAYISVVALAAIVLLSFVKEKKIG